MLVEFSDLYIPTYVANIFQFMVLTFLENQSMHFYSCPPVAHSKLLVEFFENIFPPRQKVTWNISLFPFGMIAMFLNVMTLQFLKKYQIV